MMFRYMYFFFAALHSIPRCAPRQFILSWIQVCTNTQTCHCQDNFDPQDGCSSGKKHGWHSSIIILMYKVHNYDFGSLDMSRESCCLKVNSVPKLLLMHKTMHKMILWSDEKENFKHIHHGAPTIKTFSWFCRHIVKIWKMWPIF